MPFDAFARAWLEARRDLRDATRAEHRWAIEQHLAPHFRSTLLEDLDVAAVDRYRDEQVARGELAPTSINKTLTILGAILAVADERDLIRRNPVAVNPRNRRVKRPPARRRHLDRPEQLAALLAAAGEHDAHAALSSPPSSALVFGTLAGGAQSKDNTLKRVLRPALVRANEQLECEGYAPIPDGVTQHSLRHTYISLRVAPGHDLARIARAAGHADLAVTHRIYTHVMDLDDRARKALAALVDGDAPLALADAAVALAS